MSVVGSSVSDMHNQDAFGQWDDRWIGAATPADVAPWDLPDDLVEPPVELSVQELLLEASVARPGRELLRLLMMLAERELSRDDALTVVQLWEVQEAWLVGQKQLALLAIAGQIPTQAAGFRDDEETVHELAPAWGSTIDHAGRKIAEARLLSGTLTATGDLLRAGLLSPYRAWLICDRLGDLPAELARQVEARILPTAPEAKLKDLTRRIRRAIVRADPARAEKAHREGRKDRCVWVDTEQRTPGLLGLHADLPPTLAIAIDQRLNHKADEWAAHERAATHHSPLDSATLTPAPGDGDDGLLQAGGSGVGPADGVSRTKAQRRADALAWFILGPDPDDPVRPREPDVRVQVTVDLPTLLRLRDNPGDLGKYGALPPEQTRVLAGDAQWQLLIHDPDNGYLMNKGKRVYRPNPELDAYVSGRDLTCRYPGCTTPAHLCDDDHTQPFDHDPARTTGGETSADNLANLCRRGHRVKTFLNFTYRHLGHGVLEWTTPLGRTYRTHAHDHRGDDGDDPEPPGFSATR